MLDGIEEHGLDVSQIYRFYEIHTKKWVNMSLTQSALSQLIKSCVAFDLLVYLLKIKQISSFHYLSVSTSAS